MFNPVRKPDVFRVTREFAKEISEMPAVMEDRPLDKKRLQDYRASIEAGVFRSPEWATCYCQEDDITYRVNGKHTSTLLATIDPLPSIHAVIQRYTADTYQDAVDLYLTFDRPINSKNTRDYNRAVAASIPGLHFSAEIIATIVSALAWCEWESGYGRVDRFVRAALLRENVEFAMFAGELLSFGQKRHPHLCRQGPVAALNRTFQKSPHAAMEFWSRVRDETGSSPDMPCRVLSRYLRVTPVESGQGIRAAEVMRRKAAKTREIYCKCINAWNGWRSGESRLYLKYMGDKNPLPTVL